MAIVTEINVPLTTQVKYHNKGEDAEAQFIMMAAPTSKNMVECAIIKQCFTQAAVAVSKDAEGSSSDKEDKDDSGVNPKDIIQMMFASTTDMNKLWVSAKVLFKDVVLFEGEVKASVPLIDKISIDDLQNMLGEYLVNFIAASMLSGAKKSS